MTVRPCNRLAVGAHRSGQMKFIDVYSLILTHVMLDVLSLGSAEADVGCDGNLNNDLIVSCVRHIFAKKITKIC